MNKADAVPLDRFPIQKGSSNPGAFCTQYSVYTSMMTGRIMGLRLVFLYRKLEISRIFYRVMAAQSVMCRASQSFMTSVASSFSASISSSDSFT